MKRTIHGTMIALVIFVTCGHGEGGSLGMTVTAGPDRITDDAPFMVTGVEPNGPAAHAGVRPGDRIVRIQDGRVDGLIHDEARGLLQGVQDPTVTITVARKGKVFDCRITRGK